MVEYITELRYNLVMNFRSLLLKNNITGYALSKKSGIPYTTISDLLNNKTNIGNISLKNALSISEVLGVKVEELIKLEGDRPIEFRYFRNNTLNELRRIGELAFVKKIIKGKLIDYYHKNNEKDKALYLLALIDYLSIKNGEEIYKMRYNKYRKEKLDQTLMVGSNLFRYRSAEDAENDLGIKVIPEFKKYNIVEEDIYNVA